MRRRPGQGHGEENSPQPRPCYYVLAKTTMKHFDLDGQSLEQALHHKHLGLTFSCSLSWTRHIQQVITTAKRKTGLLRYMIPKNLSPEVAIKVYLTWVRPAMEYACPAWSASIPAQESIALERVQASVAWRILSSEWTTRKSDLLRRLEWPVLWWRRAVLSVCLLYVILKTRKHPIKECIYPLVSEKSQYSFRKPITCCCQSHAQRECNNRSSSILPSCGTHCQVNNYGRSNHSRKPSNFTGLNRNSSKRSR